MSLRHVAALCCEDFEHVDERVHLYAALLYVQVTAQLPFYLTQVRDLLLQKLCLTPSLLQGARADMSLDMEFHVIGR